MPSSAFVCRRSPSSEAAVLLTPPLCRMESQDGGLVTVEGERCEPVDVSITASDPSFSSSNPLLRLFEQTNSGNIDQEREMDDFSLSAANFAGGSTDAFHFCQEYSYSGDEDDNNYFVDSFTRCSQVVRKNVNQSASPPKLLNQEEFVTTYVLGRTYHPIQDYALRRDFESTLFWFTYRSGFPEIAPYSISSDAGWGCMLRSAQMLLAHALRLHYKSREWKPSHLISNRRQDPFIRSIMNWFADYPSVKEHVYSIHNMVATGLAKYDKLPGEWYGPGTVCYVLRDLVDLHERNLEQQPQKAKTSCAGESPHSPGIFTGEQRQKIFRVHVAAQSSVYRDAIEELMTRDGRSSRTCHVSQAREAGQRQPNHPLDVAWDEELVESAEKLVDWDTSLLLLIPLRLGLKTFNEAYVRAVAHTFSLPQSVGGLGGRPRSARWLYGALSDGSKVFGLDPHTIQNAPRKRTAQINGKRTLTIELSEEYLRSVHTTYPEVFSLQKMDPSITLAFFCRSRIDLEIVFASIGKWRVDNPGCPELFTVSDKTPDYSADISVVMDDMLMSSSRMMTYRSMIDGDEIEHASDEDDYVVL